MGICEFTFGFCQLFAVWTVFEDGQDPLGDVNQEVRSQLEFVRMQLENSVNSVCSQQFNCQRESQKLENLLRIVSWQAEGYVIGLLVLVLIVDCFDAILQVEFQVASRICVEAV